MYYVCIYYIMYRFGGNEKEYDYNESLPHYNTRETGNYNCFGEIGL